MTDRRRSEILAMKPLEVQIKLLRIERAMDRLPLPQWPIEALVEYWILEGVDEINQGVLEADLTSHRLHTRKQWDRADD